MYHGTQLERQGLHATPPPFPYVQTSGAVSRPDLPRVNASEAPLRTPADTNSPAICPRCHWGIREGNLECERCGSRTLGAGPPVFHPGLSISASAFEVSSSRAAASHEENQPAPEGSSVSFSNGTPASTSLERGTPCAVDEDQDPEGVEPALLAAVTPQEHELAMKLWEMVSVWLSINDQTQEWLLDGGTLLLAILRARSGDLTKAFTLAKHFSLYREVHNWPLRLDPVECLPVLALRVCEMLPGRDINGSGLLMIVGSRLDLQLHPIEAYLKAFNLILERMLLPDLSLQKAGICVILDLDDTSGSVAMKLQGVIKTLQSTFPCKLKHVWIVNANLLMRFAIGILIKSLKPKLQERISVLPKPKHLLEWVSPSSLPPWLAGCYQSSDDEWLLQWRSCPDDGADDRNCVGVVRRDTFAQSSMMPKIINSHPKSIPCRPPG